MLRSRCSGMQSYVVMREFSKVFLGVPITTEKHDPSHENHKPHTLVVHQDIWTTLFWRTQHRPALRARRTGKIEASKMLSTCQIFLGQRFRIRSAKGESTLQIVVPNIALPIARKQLHFA
jgi:hypothetical protein